MNLLGVLWVGVPAAIGLGLSVLRWPSIKWLAFVCAVPVVLAAGLLFLAWHNAPTTYPEGGCGECEHAYGRWWEPQFTVFVLAVPVMCWILGALVGLWVRAIVDQSRVQRARATR